MGTAEAFPTVNAAFHGREYGCCNEPYADFTAINGVNLTLAWLSP